MLRAVSMKVSPFGQAAAGGGEIDGVGTQAFGGEAETRPRAGGRLEKQVPDDRAFQGFEFDFPFAGKPFELGRLIENQRDFLRRQIFQTQQMFSRPLVAKTGVECR